MDSQEVEEFKKKADGKKYEATILLADIIGCADISNEHSIEEYACILNQFHESAYEAYRFCGFHNYREHIIEFGLKGDEACLILHSRDLRDSNEKTLIEDIKSAIIFAISIKLLWRASPYNKDRVIKDGLFPRNVAIGINQGPVYFYQNPDFNSLPQNLKSSEGYAINLAKRIETESRSGSCSNIFTSSRVKYWAEKAEIPIKFEERRIQGVKTIAVLYEVSEIENKFVDLIRELIEKINFDHEEWHSFRRLAEIDPTDFWTNCLVHFKEEIRKKKEIITEMPGIPEEKKISKQDTAFYLDEARKNYSMSNYEEAIKLYNKAIEIDAKCSLTYHNRGNAYFCLNKYEEAIQNYTKAIDIDENHLSSYYNRGWIYYKQKQYEKAIEDYTKAIEINPDYSPAYNDRGKVYNHLNQYERAIEDHNKTIELDPNCSKAYSSRGIDYWDSNQHEKAIEDFNKAIKLDPNYSEAYKNLIEALIMLENFQEATEILEKYSKIADSLKDRIILYYLTSLAKLLSGAPYSESLRQLINTVKENKDFNLKDWSFDQIDRFFKKTNIDSKKIEIAINITSLLKREIEIEKIEELLKI